MSETRVERPPNCGICGNEMRRLRRNTDRKHLPVFVCVIGEKRKPPCDGDAANLGSRI